MEGKPKPKYQKPKLTLLGKIKWDEEAFNNGQLKEEILRKIKESHRESAPPGDLPPAQENQG